MLRSVRAFDASTTGTAFGPNPNRKMLHLGVPTANNYLLSLGVDPTTTVHFCIAAGQAPVTLRVEDYGAALLGEVRVFTGGAVNGIVLEVSGE